MRMTLRRALSPLFIAACMSSVKRSFSDMTGKRGRSVESTTPCGRGARVALHVPLHGSGLLALAFLSGFLVKLSASQLGQYAGFFTGTFETAERRVEVLALSYSDARHRIPTK